MKCTNCQNEVQLTDHFCDYCGQQLTPLDHELNQQGPYQQPMTEDKIGLGLIILIILVPLMGLVLYFVWLRSAPNKAKQCLKAFVAGFALNFIAITFGAL